jgi:hypothetical protein
MADLDFDLDHPVFYTLNEKREPVPLEMTREAIGEWAHLVADRKTAWRVAEDRVGAYRISTVFTGTDMSFFGDARMFETMVFFLGKTESSKHSATWAEAEAQHRAIVEKIKEQVSER